MNLAPGDSFEGRYEVRSELGGSEFSVVYRATSIDTGRDVVIRVLLAPPASGYPTGFEQRFIAEAKHVSKLRHAATVRLESFGAASDGALYLVTEFISGSNLADAMGEQGVSARDALGLTKRMAEALGEAHARGIVHRELKPENIAIPLRRGVLGAKLRDFGITKYVEDDGPIGAAAVGFGSPRYMSPEQVMGKNVGPSANIYSLGLMLYELLVGEPAIKATSSREVLSHHLSTTEFELPANLPTGVTSVLSRMIAKSDDDRFATTTELLSALNAIDSSAFDDARRINRVVRAIERADAHGVGEATLIEPLSLEEDSSVSTKERFNDITMPERPRGASRPEVLTPTNIVAASDVRPPRGDADTDERTDEMPEREKPTPRRSNRPTSNNDTLIEGAEVPRERDKPKPTRPPRKKRRTPLPEPVEERVSPWFAIAALVGAVALALGITWVVLRARTQTAEPIVIRQVVKSNPFAAKTPVVDDEPPPQIPSVAMDMGLMPPMDLGSVPTGCGIVRAHDWNKQTEVVGLTERSHDVYVPSSYNGTPVPMVLVVHPPGGGTRTRWFVKQTALTRLADNLGAILVVPKAAESWRPWLDDPEATAQELERVVMHAMQTYCVDINQVFGIGMSTGAVALDQFACANPGRFRAIGLVASWVPVRAECETKNATPAIYVNGGRDRVSPVGGGGGCYGTDLRLPMDDVFKHLQKTHHCKDPVEWQAEVNGVCHKYEGCEADLVRCHVPEGRHSWPGSHQMMVQCLDNLMPVKIVTFPTTLMIERFFQMQLK